MPIELIGLLEDIETFESKTGGFGGNVTISKKLGKKTKRISFMTRSKEVVTKLEPLLDKTVRVKISLQQNNFGLRLGEVIDVGVGA